MLRNNDGVLFLWRNKMRSSMNVHGVQSIRAMVEPLEYGNSVCSTTKLVITGADGNEFTVTCFSDQPVAVETVTVEAARPAPVAAETEEEVFA